jgi:hypothetical protein
MKSPLQWLRPLACLSLAVLPLSIHAANLPLGSNQFGSAINFESGHGFSPPTNLSSYTSEASEPGHRPNGSVGAGKTAWWRWTAPEDGFVSIDTLAAIEAQTEDPVLNTVLAVYTGSSLTNLVRVTANDDSWLLRTPFFYTGLSNVAFYATRGVTYRFAVDGGLAGSVSSSATSVVIQLRQLSARKLTRQAIWGDSNVPGLRGSLSLTQTSTNVFTAILTMGARTIRFRGVFDIEGYYRASFDRPTPAGAPPLPPVFIEIDGIAGGVLRTVDSLGSRTFVEFPEVATFSATAPNPVAGYYTAGAGFTGYVTATISSSGLARGSVRAPDGSIFTFSRPLTRAIVPGQFFLPILRMLRNGTGFWSVHTRIVDAGTKDDWYHFGSTNRFVRAPSPGAAYYPAGLDQPLLLIGGAYSRPDPGQRALGFLNGSSGGGTFQLTATPGELAATVAQLLTWSDANRIDFLSTSLRPTLSFNARTGFATGGITLPGESRRTLRGILHRHQTATYFGGYATGKSQTVRMSITPST